MTCIFFGGRGSAGTSATTFVNDAGITKRIARGWDTSSMNYHTGQMEQFNVLAFQDPTGAPWPNTMDFMLNWMRNGADITINGVKYTSPKIKYDQNKVIATGLSFGGSAVFLFAGVDQNHANSVKLVGAIAPQTDILMRNHPQLPKYTPETACQYLANAKVPVIMYTGSTDGFLDNADKIEELMKVNRGTVFNLVAQGLGHAGGVWETFYAGTIKVPWDGKSMNFYELGLYLTQAEVVDPPVDPPVEPVVTLKVGETVDVKDKANPTATYSGIVVKDWGKGQYDIFCYDLVKFFPNLTNQPTAYTNYSWIKRKEV